LSLRYIFDAKAGPQDHADLMQGVEANWYEVKRNLDRLPRTSDPEKATTFTPKIQGQLKQWGADRLKERM
jgi:hypothetical protein